jgi:leader peptidase (prepilin peptidase)/N-methyltransferase
VQYPIIEAANGIIYVITFAVHGLSIESAIYCLLFSALLALSVIDFRTFEIPFGINVFILTLGVVHLGLDYLNWRHYVIGLLSVSIFLAILYYLSGGRAIGGGDVKLMGAAGLLIGWKLIILAFFLGCIFGSVIHIIRMKLTKAEHVLAMGPYLSAGIFLSALWGDQMIEWYLRLYGR